MSRFSAPTAHGPQLGTAIGHYDVTGLIAEGGMGQVWHATDTQLNRIIPTTTSTTKASASWRFR